MIEAYFRPKSLRQALRLKAQWGADAIAFSGSSDWMVKLRAGRAKPKAIIDLQSARLGFIRRNHDWIRIGAAATAGDLLRTPWALQEIPSLCKACVELGGPQVQNVATLAGNLANASPAADTPPVLITLQAEAILQSSGGGPRILPVESFLLGPGKTALAPDELILEIRIPRLGLRAKRGEKVAMEFFKMGPRRAQIISVCCLACYARLARAEEPNGAQWKIEGVRLAAGGVAPRAVRLSAAEAFLRGQILEEGPAGRGHLSEIAVQAASLAGKDVSPISDVRGSADYKAALARNFTRAFVESL